MERDKQRFNKFGILVRLLEKNEIDRNDLIVSLGDVREEMMREESSLHIHIPRLNRTVFLSNEWGEASFVFEGIVPENEFYDNLNKEELLQKRNGVPTQFYKNHIENWKNRMQAALYNEIKSPTTPNPIREKTDVKEYEKSYAFYRDYLLSNLEELKVNGGIEYGEEDGKKWIDLRKLKHPKAKKLKINEI